MLALALKRSQALLSFEAQQANRLGLIRHHPIMRHPLSRQRWHGRCRHPAPAIAGRLADTNSQVSGVSRLRTPPPIRLVIAGPRVSEAHLPVRRQRSRGACNARKTTLTGNSVNSYQCKPTRQHRTRFTNQQGATYATNPQQYARMQYKWRLGQQPTMASADRDRVSLSQLPDTGPRGLHILLSHPTESQHAISPCCIQDHKGFPTTKTQNLSPNALPEAVFRMVTRIPALHQAKNGLNIS